MSKKVQLENLKTTAEIHNEFYGLYIRILRDLSQSPDYSGKNSSPWKTLKNGSHLLENAYNLVETYKECFLDAIDDNIQLINDTLIGLEFDPEHITYGYTDEVYSGKAKCFVSKGQGTVYYKLLHSNLKKDIKLFIEIVERNINVPVKKFLESFDQKLNTIYLEKLLEAMKNKNTTDIYNWISTKTVNSRDANGRLPLDYAILNGNIGIIRILFKNGADITQVTKKHNTPLHIAASKGNKEVLEVLLAHITFDQLNDIINLQTSGGHKTALHIAAENGFLEIVKVFLKHGASYNITNKDDKTPFDLSNNSKVSDLLRMIGERFEAAKDGRLEIINNLNTEKFDDLEDMMNVRNKQGETLLQVAIHNKHKDIANVLLMKPVKMKIQSLTDLKYRAKVYIDFSKTYITILERMVVAPSGCQENYSPKKTLEEGSYLLGNAHDLVRTYKEYMSGAIEDKNIQKVNDILVGLEFDAEHITYGFTDELYGGRSECFISKGQGTVYYKLLHTDLTEDIRNFIKIVQGDLDVSVKKFLQSVEQELQNF